MNNSIPETFFCSIPKAPRDPILGITEAFNADENPKKVNLGVGVYYNDDGRVPLLKCVQQAEEQMLFKAMPHTYIPIDGLAAYNRVVQALVFGAGSAVIRENRVATMQAIGGTGALKIGADFLKRFSPDSQVWISNPSWENHRALFESAGFIVNAYPYYSPVTGGIDFEGMMTTLKTLPIRSVVLLHACCHNPTGADLSGDQWEEVIAVVAERGLIPFLDMAYQGFAEGVEADGRFVRRFAEVCSPLLVSSSFSKSFSLYGERVGAFSIVANSTEARECAVSQLKRVIRTNYSSPPLHGAQVVATVLLTPELRQLWEDELSTMRVRIQQMRQELVANLSMKKPDQDFNFILRQNGMFSYSGLNKAQVEILQKDFSIYAVDTGRICLAALNSKNMPYIVDAIASVL